MARKTVKKTTTKHSQSRKQSSAGPLPAGDVDAYMAALEHPLKRELESLRRLIRGADPAIREGIKWNSPSFRTSEWFATINVCGGGRPPRPKDPPSLRMILHTGARATAAAKAGFTIADPRGLLKWLGKDRAMVTIANAEDLRVKRTGLTAIFREWARRM